MIDYEFILIGIGLNEGITKKGVVCPVQPCDRGLPTLKHEDDSDYAKDGYRKIQGPSSPLVLGGRRFATEKEAVRWLATKGGKRFKEVFLNVYIARVVA